jgi:hypothetical protein
MSGDAITLIAAMYCTESSSLSSDATDCGLGVVTRTVSRVLLAVGGVVEGNVKATTGVGSAGEMSIAGAQANALAAPRPATFIATLHFTWRLLAQRVTS